jgi:hypothetical protein
LFIHIFAFAFTLCFTACSIVDKPEWTVKMGVLSKKKIFIQENTKLDKWHQTAEIIEGDSLVFFRSSYKERGEEGQGYTLCFTIKLDGDSIAYAPGKKELIIIGFGTGLLPNLADTVRDYRLEVKRQGESIGLLGKIDGKDISGTYVPN